MSSEIKNVTKIKTREPEGTLSYEIKREDKDELVSIFDQFEFKTKPREHQYRALALGLLSPNFLYALDMGLGKTKIALDLITIYKKLGKVKKSLVVCPPSVIRQWRQEIRKHSYLSHAIVDGKSYEEKEWVFLNSDRDILIVSQSWLTRVFSRVFNNQTNNQLLNMVANSDEGNTDQKIKWLKKIKSFDLLIIDEAHITKNVHTITHRGYRDWVTPLIKYKYFLTGTPIGNSFTGAYGIYRVLDSGETYGRSYNRFLKKYFNEYFIKQFIRKYDIKPEVKEEFFCKFWNKAVRWEEQECIDLPDKIHTSIPVSLTDKELLKCSKLIEFKDELGHKLFYKLMGVTGGQESKSSSECSKYQALKELILNICVEQERRLVVWCWLRAENELLHEWICKDFKKLSVRNIYGGTRSEDREKYLNEWKRGRVQVLILNQKSCGIGIDLQEASRMVFYSNSYSATDRSQSEKRIHRIGQTQKCYYYDLWAEETVDQVILETLNKVRKTVGEFTKDDSLYTKSREVFEEMQNIKTNKTHKVVV